MMSRLSNLVEIYNETTILIVSLMLFLFSDISKEKNLRLYGSYMIIGLILLSIVLNLMLILFKSVK